MERVWDLGKKMALGGAVLVAVPIAIPVVVPCLFVLSITGVALSLPVASAAAGYVVFKKIVGFSKRKLLGYEESDVQGANHGSSGEAEVNTPSFPKYHGSKAEDEEPSTPKYHAEEDVCAAEAPESCVDLPRSSDDGCEIVQAPEHGTDESHAQANEDSEYGDLVCGYVPSDEAGKGATFTCLPPQEDFEWERVSAEGAPEGCEFGEEPVVVRRNVARQDSVDQCRADPDVCLVDEVNETGYARDEKKSNGELEPKLQGSEADEVFEDKTTQLDDSREDESKLEPKLEESQKDLQKVETEPLLEESQKDLQKEETEPLLDEIQKDRQKEETEPLLGEDGVKSEQTLEGRPKDEIKPEQKMEEQETPVADKEPPVEDAREEDVEEADLVQSKDEKLDDQEKQKVENHVQPDSEQMASPHSDDGSKKRQASELNSLPSQGPEKVPRDGDKAEETPEADLEDKPVVIEHEEIKEIKDKPSPKVSQPKETSRETAARSGIQHDKDGAPRYRKPEEEEPRSSVDEYVSIADEFPEDGVLSSEDEASRTSFHTQEPPGARSEDLLLREILMVQKVVGYTDDLRDSPAHEVERLYDFLGMELPLGYEDTNDPRKLLESLDLLMAIVGIK